MNSCLKRGIDREFPLKKKYCLCQINIDDNYAITTLRILLYEVNLKVST